MPEQLTHEDIDAVVLQRPTELELVQTWTSRRPDAEMPCTASG